MMDEPIAARYLAPKWQAYVTPSEKGFVFANGLRVLSLWELKRALLELPEDLVLAHVSDGKNHVADWVENVVGDKELGEELRKQSHRWGMIVALERQMMRTLNLPDYVAARWLAKTEQPFTFASGEKVYDLEKLAEVLADVSEEVVAFHKERRPNDIAVWVGDMVGDFELAALLEEASGRWQMQRFVEDHVAMLKEASE